MIEAKYLITDTTGVLVMQTDTLELQPKISYEKRMKLKMKEIEKWKKEQEKKRTGAIMLNPKLAHRGSKGKEAFLLHRFETFEEEEE